MAKQLKKLIESGEVRLDGHVHFYTNPRPNANVWWRDPGRRDLIFLIEKVREKKLNGICLVNAGDDWNYERYFSQARFLPKNWGYFEGERLFQVVDSKGVPITFVKAEETFPPEGHVLFWGVDYGKMLHKENFSCEKMLDLAKRDALITTISDHPFFKGGLAVKGNLKKYLDYFDAIEWNAEVESDVRAMANPVWRFLLRRTGMNSEEVKKANLNSLVFGKSHNKAVVYNSDCHWPSGLGSAYNVYEQKVLDFNNEEDFLLSLKSATSQGKFRGVAGQTSLSEVLYHSANVKLVHALEKLGKKYDFVRRLKLNLLSQDRERDNFSLIGKE